MTPQMIARTNQDPATALLAVRRSLDVKIEVEELLAVQRRVPRGGKVTERQVSLSFGRWSTSVRSCSGTSYRMTQNESKTEPKLQVISRNCDGTSERKNPLTPEGVAG